MQWLHVLVSHHYANARCGTHLLNPSSDVSQDMFRNGGTLNLLHCCRSLSTYKYKTQQGRWFNLMERVQKKLPKVWSFNQTTPHRPSPLPHLVFFTETNLTPSFYSQMTLVHMGTMMWGPIRSWRLYKG